LAVAHVHVASSGGNRAEAGDVLEQQNLAGAEATVGTEVDADEQRNRPGFAQVGFAAIVDGAATRVVLTIVHVQPP
jgi:hypothetical protein